jgi:hypothetical protein
VNTPPHQAPLHPFPRLFENPLARVGLLTGVALLVEVLLMKYSLDVSPSLFIVLGPLWFFSIFKLSGRRDRISEVIASIAIVVVTALVLIAYTL